MSELIETTTINVRDLLLKMDACDDALYWLDRYQETHPQGTAETAWNDCPNGEWLLWLAKRLGLDIDIAASACLSLFPDRWMSPHQTIYRRAMMAFDMANAPVLEAAAKTIRDAISFNEIAWAAHRFKNLRIDCVPNHD